MAEGMQRVEESPVLMRGLAHVRSARSYELDGTDGVYDHILTLARERALNASVFSRREPFPWLAEASSNVIDFYGTRMTPSLDNFTRDLKEGVAFLQSHSNRDFVGQSVDAWRVKEDKGNRDDLLIGGFFTVRGIKIGTVATDDWVDAMEAGIIRDVSIGFYSDDIRCTICGKQIFDFWAYFFDPDNYCPHIPLEEYQKLDDDGEPVVDANGDPVMEMAIGDVYDGQLVEVSGVYEGAAPGAQVQKAEAFARHGLLSDRTIKRLERRYRMRLPEKEKTLHPAKTFSSQSFVTLTPEQLATLDARASFGTATIMTASGTTGNGYSGKGENVAELLSADMRDNLKKRGIGGDLANLTEELLSRVLEGWDATAETVESLRADAEDGVRYRDDLIDEALKAGVRAKGSEFREEQYRTILHGLDIDEIKIMRDDWLRDGDERLAGKTGEVGGRRTQEGSEVIDIKQRSNRKSDVAHAG